MISSFQKTQHILHRSMGAEALRREVISDNLANVETPGFKRGEVTFEAEMRRALSSEKAERIPVVLTDKRHIDFHEIKDFRKVRARRKIDYLSKHRNNGNNVDIDREITGMAKSLMHYEFLIERISGNYRKINSILKG